MYDVATCFAVCLLGCAEFIEFPPLYATCVTGCTAACSVEAPNQN
jgi:hypothetical protein